MKQEHRQLLEVTVPNIIVTVQAIELMAERRKLTIKGAADEVRVPIFKSEAQMQKCRRQMNRALTSPTMKSANTFLRWVAGNMEVEYSAKEQAIRAKRTALLQAQAAARAARLEYLLEKGDFYGGRVRAVESVDDKTKARTVTLVPKKVTDGPSE